MHYTVEYGQRPESGTAFAAFTALSDALEFAGMTAKAEPGIAFSVYEDGALVETFKTDENEGEK